MSDEIREITKRAEFSRSRLELIRDRITKLDVLSELPRLCIYVTGSFGRLEASEHSDLDVFFIHEGSCVRDAVPRIRKTLLDADLIRAAQDLEFPDRFSNDGQYLKIHYINDILDNLGGPRDDFNNHFTARLRQFALPPLLHWQTARAHHAPRDARVQVIQRGDVSQPLLGPLL